MRIPLSQANAKDLVEGFRKRKPLLFRQLLQIGEEVIVDSYCGSHNVIIASLALS